MKVLSGRILFDIFLLTAAAFGLWQARSLPPARGISQIGAADFPTAVCALGIVAVLAVLVQDLRAGAAAPADRLDWRTSAAVAAVAALLALYIALLEPLGFFAATSGFIFVTTLACAWFLAPKDAAPALRRTAVTAAIVAVAATGLSYLVFSIGFGLIFP